LGRDKPTTVCFIYLILHFSSSQAGIERHEAGADADKGVDELNSISTTTKKDGDPLPLLDTVRRKTCSKFTYGGVEFGVGEVLIAVEEGEAIRVRTGSEGQEIIH
jgi:hypothetical protein